MARMEHGLLGSFSGKIGDVIGFKRNGIQYIRSISKKKNTDHSPARTAHMAKFTMLTKFLSPLSHFMNQVHKKNFKGKSGYNKLCSLNMKEIVTGSYPDFKIDYYKVVVTKGPLKQPDDATVACARPGKLVFTWNESNDHHYEMSTDFVYIAIYDDEIKCWKIFENAATRKDGKCTLNLTEHRGHPVQSYIGFIAHDGLRVSNSQYIGMINVL
jgi:hypothetical protein